MTYDHTDEDHRVQDQNPAYLYETCNGCNAMEELEMLFEHEASGEKKLCQDCLCRYLKAGIETDGKDYFREWEFKRFLDDVKCFQATNEGVIFVASTLEEVLEHVLSRLKLI